MAFIILLFFIVTMLIGLPVLFSMGITSIFAFGILGGNLQIIPLKMFTGVDNFVYLAIPLFILASEIMTTGGITQRIVHFCNNLVGHITGGLAYVNILASIFFAGISGSATADAAGLGKIEIDMMETAGYPKKFAASTTAASAIIGPIIPPSTIMIIYAVVAGNVSVSEMFLAGFVPGLLIGIAEIFTVFIVAKKNSYPKSEKIAKLKEIWTSFIQTLPSLLLPIIIIAGIVSGVFTATESAAVAVLYALLVTKFILKTLNWKDFYQALVNTAKTTANVMVIIAISTAMAWVITALRIPQTVTTFFLNYANSTLLFLLFVNFLLLLVGMLLDQSPALLIMVPILLPVAIQFGIDPLHFGIVVIINLCVGLVTPPVGMTLFVTSNVAKLKLTHMYTGILIYLPALFITLLMITFIPSLTTWLPSVIG
jgi:tripartite ATP-independent transporter DctM subunit